MIFQKTENEPMETAMETGSKTTNPKKFLLHIYLKN